MVGGAAGKKMCEKETKNSKRKKEEAYNNEKEEGLFAYFIDNRNINYNHFGDCCSTVVVIIA